MTSTLAPRDHAKTTIACFLNPMYTSLVEPEAYRHYLNVQATNGKAINVNLSLRLEFETNEAIALDYGSQVTADKWTEKQFVLKNGVVFTGIGAGESMRGINYRNIRPDYIVVDDLYDEEDINQIARVQKKNKWFLGSLYPSRNSRGRCSIHVLGTAVNREDLMHVLEKKKGVTFRKFQAIIDEPNKITLWKPFEELMQDKELMGSIIFNREMQNDLRDDETAIIKSHWIQYYDGSLPDHEEIDKVICGVDPATGEKSHNDFTAMTVIVVTKLRNYYIHDVIQDRYSFEKRIRAIEAFYEKHGFRKARVEAIAAFQDFAKELRRTTRVPVEIITSVKDKISRKESQSAKFETGKVLINSQICDEFREELVYQLITNKPWHDDISDAVIIALEDGRAETMVSF